MRPTVAVDVDGVLADYSLGWQGIDHIGDPIPGAREFLTSLKEFADVVIWTTRCNTELSGRSGEGAHLLRRRVEDWLKKHELPYDDIFTGPAKPIASAIVDDRAVPCRPQHDRVAFEVALRRVRMLCDNAPAGATGVYPDGKVGPEDEGEIRFSIGKSEAGNVVMDFGKPVQWLELPPNDATKIATVLFESALSCMSTEQMDEIWRAKADHMVAIMPPDLLRNFIELMRKRRGGGAS